MFKIIYVVKVCGVEVFSSDNELVAYAYKAQCHDRNVVVVASKRRY